MRCLFILSIPFWSKYVVVIFLMQQPDEKMEKIIYARDGEELYGAVTIKQRKGQPFPLAKLLLLQRKDPRQAEEPPPAPAGSKGKIP